jgi:hypothetical protein
VPGRIVPGFAPSSFGFRFPNQFPKVPLRRIGIPGVVSVPIGDASNGLCGGMVFASRDYFEERRRPPQRTTAPGKGPLYDYLVVRVFDSFNLPYGPMRYLELMHPSFPDGETVWSRLGLGPHGRAWVMIRQEWPKVRADIDSGHPSPLGLIRVKSTNPFDLKYDHQVLAYAYDLTGSLLTLSIYDPNWPDRDDVTMSLDTSNPTRPTTVTVTPPDWSVYAFFRVSYRRSTPP